MDLYLNINWANVNKSLEKIESSKPIYRAQLSLSNHLIWYMLNETETETDRDREIDIEIELFLLFIM